MRHYGLKFAEYIRYSLFVYTYFDISINKVFAIYLYFNMNVLAKYK